MPENNEDNFYEGKYLSRVGVNLFLDLRVSSSLCRLCRKFPREVYIESDNAIMTDKDNNVFYGLKRADGKRILDVIGLAGKGDVVRICVEGRDSESADLVSKLGFLLTTNDKSEIDYKKLGLA